MHHHNSLFNGTCPVPHGAESLTVKGTSHHPMYIIAGVCAIISFVSSVALILTHLTRYRAPKEQRQIIRIIFTPFVFAIIAFGELADYRIAAYIDPVGELYESWALCGMFLLLLQYAAPTSTFGEDMFEAVHAAAQPDKKGNSGSWPKLTWILVFQYPVLEIIALIVLEATVASGTYCASSLRPSFGHFWSQILRTIGTVVCVMAILKFWGRMKPLMKTRRVGIKLIVLKGLVGLHLLQGWIFNALVDRHAIHDSKQTSYGDLLYGLPNVLSAVEMVLFSAGCWYAYGPGEYGQNARPNLKPIGFISALLDSLNPSDLLLGILRAGGLIAGLKSAQFDQDDRGRHEPVPGAPYGYNGGHTGGYRDSY